MFWLDGVTYKFQACHTSDAVLLCRSMLQELIPTWLTKAKVPTRKLRTEMIDVTKHFYLLFLSLTPRKLCGFAKWRLIAYSGH